MESRIWKLAAGGTVVTVAAATARGRRAENQDGFVAVLPDGRAYRLHDERLVEEAAPGGWPDGGVRLAVADGMGGHADGRAISQALLAALARVPFQRHPADLRRAVLTLHAGLYEAQAGKEDQCRGGSTLVMADIDLTAKTAVRLHVGDSRAYLSHGRRWSLLTMDHHYFELLFRAGGLTRAEYSTYRASSGPDHTLAQAIGYNPSLRIDLDDDLPDDMVAHADAALVKLGAGDRLLLASDGFYRGGIGGAEPLPPDAGGGDLTDRVWAGRDTAGDNLTAVMLGIAGLDVAGAEA